MQIVVTASSWLRTWKQPKR
jgi:hypothetical protein